MLLYVVRRLAWTIIVVLIVLLLTFAVFYLLPAGDPALRFAGKSPTAESLALIRERLGLDQPWYEQFGRFVGNFVRGDENGWPGLGYSYVTNQPVLDLVTERLPRTLLLIAGAATIWLTVGVTIGVISAVKRRSVGRPAGDGLRALRDLGTRLLARPDGAVHLLEEARAHRRARATSR